MGIKNNGHVLAGHSVQGMHPDVSQCDLAPVPQNHLNRAHSHPILEIGPAGRLQQ